MKKTLLTAMLCVGANVFAGSQSYAPKITQPFSYLPNETYTRPGTYTKPQIPLDTAYKNTGVVGPIQSGSKPVQNTMLQYGE